MIHAAATVMLDLPRPDRSRIDASQVAAALRVVDLADVVDTIAEWREHDTVGRGAGGRPAVISDRAALTIFMLLACAHRPLHVRQGALMLARQLDEEGLALLGITPPVGHTGGADDWYQRLWRAIHRILDVIDPYPAPRNRRLTAEEITELKNARDPAVQTIRRLRLDWVSNRLIEATWQLLPRRVRRAERTNVCIDATPVRAHARGRKTSDATTEPDAGWYVREGEHLDTGDPNKRHKYGWEIHLAVACTNDPLKPATGPLMVTGVSFDRPGKRIAENAMTILTSMTDRGYPPGLIATDRAYWPNSQPDKLQLPARALGWNNINDYKETERGVKAGHAGGIQVEGAWYCPSMPQPLITATIDYLQHKTIDKAIWKQRIEERARYMLKAKENPDADGHQPLRCPAVGPSATAACPLRPASMTPTATAAKRARITSPPEHPDRICTQTSVSFPPTAGAKYRQDYQFGSKQWADWYKTMRSTVEGFNGYVKDAAYEDLETPAKRRLRGRAAQHLLVTLLIVSANLRKLQSWSDQQTNPTKVAQIAARRETRRARQSLKGHLPPSTAPPGTPATATA